MRIDKTEYHCDRCDKVFLQDAVKVPWDWISFGASWTEYQRGFGPGEETREQKGLYCSKKCVLEALTEAM